MTDSVLASDLTKTIDHLLNDVLGFDRDSDVVSVTTTPSKDKDGEIVVTIDFSLGPLSIGVAEIFSFVLDVNKLKQEHDYTFELERKIKEGLEGFVSKYVDKQIEGIGGVERGVATAATAALNKLLASELVKPIATHLTESLLALDLPERSEIIDLLDKGLDRVRKDYFEVFIPEIAKAYAKMGLAEILTIATSSSSPEWATAIRSVGEGVLHAVIDTIVTGYFDDLPLGEIDVFKDVKFTEVFGKAMANLLFDFKQIDKEILDDFLGLDGDNLVERLIADLVDGKIQEFVEDQFVDALSFLAGEFDPAQIDELFVDFIDDFDVQEILGNFFVNFASNQLAELFVDIDSLPEALLSRLGSTIGSGALGQALGSLAMDAVVGLFGEATASVIGTAIFEGLGTILGAGIGAIAGSVVFELLDELFDGAISDLFEGIIDWIRNDSPQAYYRTTFDPETNEFHGAYLYSKDSEADLRLAVQKTMEAFEDKINTVIAFVGEPASFDPYFDIITFVWGKKHFNESYASYITGNESNKLSYNRSAEHVAKETIGAALSHMNFHNGHPITALAYDQWKAGVAAAGGGSLSYYQTDALLDLQELIGLARFANDYRQDPTAYDLLMASDAPVAVTILQQYLQAEVKGFNAPTTLKGSVLGFETIGSAAAGDTIILDGPAWRAVARGGDDIIHVGAASRQEIDGGEGMDTVILSKDRSAYLATVVNGGGYGVVLTDVASGIQITVLDVEQFRFNGVTLSFDAAFPEGHLIPGTNGNDVISVTLAPAGQPTATVSNDTIYGADGDDVIDASRGADFVLGDQGNDRLYGGDGNDRLYGWTGHDVVFGGAGEDTLSGEVGDDLLDGGTGHDLLDGGDGADQLIAGAGTDLLYGQDGNDVLYFGAFYAPGDLVNGGAGRDAFVLQGNYAVTLNWLSPLGGPSLIGIESISLQSGANTKYGDTANNRYDYSLVAADTNVAAGQQLIVNAQSLLAGEDFAFDGSAEIDGSYLIYAGHGVDVLKGGTGNEIFYFEGQRWGPNDRVDGGSGQDSVVISAATGLNHFEFGSSSLTKIESISLNNRYASDPLQKPSYELVLNNGNVAPGGTLIVNGSSIAAGQVVNIDGRGIHDGNLILFGGGGHDVIAGGGGGDLIVGGSGADTLAGLAGADTFRYDSVSDSTAGAPDLIGDFQTGVDRIDLSRIDANTAVAGDQAFAWIGSSAFTGVAGQLRSYEANGYKWIAGDTNGDGAADLVIALSAGTAPLVQGDFLL